MKIDMGGQPPTIDEHNPEKLLDLPPEEVQLLMRAGEITSRFEPGMGEDAGNIGLTFFHHGRRVRLTCLKDGSALTKSRVTTERP